MMLPDDVTFVRRLDIPYPSVVAQVGTEIQVELRVRRFGPCLPMRLLVSRWSSLRPMTMVELVPCRSVRPTPRYFAAGHHFLDDLASRLGADRQQLEEAV